MHDLQRSHHALVSSCIDVTHPLGQKWNTGLVITLLKFTRIRVDARHPKFPPLIRTSLCGKKLRLLPFIERFSFLLIMSAIVHISLTSGKVILMDILVNESCYYQVMVPECSARCVSLTGDRVVECIAKGYYADGKKIGKYFHKFQPPTFPEPLHRF
ncbi:hypothetical protein F5J12DRAFT_347125 [Pisolithus orientalis]|uniref:uncharacterized protein n=1 Tax=Pisolithus orientalis TaxID=936130 RepID=UPI0022250768|nr:uncharacterized protein F5J12DRAFT_347125 [Pisolithus orientalis]KAI5996867.1 hypothetical protein F5J12DRAFT_347125 [Pisolithus orientalis]